VASRVALSSIELVSYDDDRRPELGSSSTEIVLFSNLATIWYSQVAECIFSTGRFLGCPSVFHTAQDVHSLLRNVNNFTWTSLTISICTHNRDCLSSAVKSGLSLWGRLATYDRPGAGILVGQAWYTSTYIRGRQRRQQAGERGESQRGCSSRSGSGPPVFE
jgi:hypothetical protein